MYLSQVERSLDRIDPQLRAKIGKLADGSAPWPLFLHGKAGAGKTCAALCLLDHAGGRYFTAADLCQTLADIKCERLEWDHEGRGGTLTMERFWGQQQSAPLVVIDELGTRDKVSDHQYESIKQMLDVRYAKPLICISNLEPATIERVYDDRIFSRMMAGTIIDLADVDRRLEEWPPDQTAPAPRILGTEEVA